MCISRAAPFALIGFVKSPDNLYYEVLKETIQDHEREAVCSMGQREKQVSGTKTCKHIHSILADSRKYGNWYESFRAVYV